MIDNQSVRSKLIPYYVLFCQNYRFFVFCFFVYSLFVLNNTYFLLQGHPVDGSWVFGMFERGSTKCCLRIVERRDAETLIPIILENVLPGECVISYFEQISMQEMKKYCQLFICSSQARLLSAIAGKHTTHWNPRDMNIGRLFDFVHI